MATKGLNQGCLWACLLGWALVGCKPGNPPTYPVTGTITMKGKPVQGATIVLVPQNKESLPSTAVSDKDGKYSFTTFASGDGVTEGSYTAKVFKFEAAFAPPANPKTEEEYNPDLSTPPPPKNLLPKKYESEKTSELSLEVKRAPTTFDIVIP